MLQLEWKQLKEQRSKSPKSTGSPTIAALELHQVPQQLVFSKKRKIHSTWGIDSVQDILLRAWKKPLGQCRLSSEVSGFSNPGPDSCSRGCIPNRSRHKRTRGSTRSQARSTLQPYRSAGKRGNGPVFPWFIAPLEFFFLGEGSGVVFGGGNSCSGLAFSNMAESKPTTTHKT